MVRQEQEAQAWDAMLAAHQQVQEQESEWKTQRHEVWGTKKDGKLVAVQSFAQQIVHEAVDRAAREAERQWAGDGLRGAHD